MNPDWISALIEGKIEEPLASLSLTSPHGSSYQGSGRLFWHRNGQIIIEGITSCDEFLLKRSLSFPLPGKIYTGAEFWRLKGELAKRGWEVSAKRITTHPSLSYLGSSPVALWKIFPQEAHFKQRIGRTLPNTLEGIITPCPGFLWTKSSHINDNNPVFGWNSDKTDWWDMSIEDVKIYLRDSGDNSARLRINQAEKKFGSLHRWSTAFITSLSFLYGQRIEWIGFQAYIKQIILSVLVDKAETGPAPFPPLGRKFDPERKIDREALLSCATKFFRNPKSRDVKRLLYLYWGSFSAFLPAQALLMASILEGLLRASKESVPTLFEENAALAKEIEAVHHLLGQHPAEFSTGFMNRVSGMLSSFHGTRGKDILQNIKDASWFSVTDTEIDSWDRIRNPHSHGDFSQWVKDIQSGWDRTACIANLINKTMLFLIGYDGKYVDYSERGYPENAFVSKQCI